MARTPEPPERKSIQAHLRELAVRIKWSLFWIVTGVVVAFIFREVILSWLVAPLANAMGDQTRLHFSSPIEPFFTYMRLALQAGLILAIPGLIWQVWAFIGPGLHANERRFLLTVTFWGVLFFSGGVLFAYYLVLPHGFQFLLSFAQGEVEPVFHVFRMPGTPDAQIMAEAGRGALHLQATIMMDGYLKLIMNLLFVFGVVFELPLFLYFLAVSGIVSIRGLLRFFRYFVVISFFLSAFLTPPDVITQILLAVPLIVMYILSVGVAWVVLRRKK